MAKLSRQRSHLITTEYNYYNCTHSTFKSVSGGNYGRMPARSSGARAGELVRSPIIMHEHVLLIIQIPITPPGNGKCWCSEHAHMQAAVQ